MKMNQELRTKGFLVLQIKTVIVANENLAGKFYFSIYMNI